MASSGSNGTGTRSGTGSSPCGACKFLRRKCAADCIFAPYFCSEQGPSQFAAIHKVFGSSNVSKLLLHVPVQDRCEAVVTIAYEAQARIRDPVYGCVSHIFALQQQVAYLQAQLMQVKGQMAQNLIEARSLQNQWPGSTNIATGGGAAVMFPTNNNFMNSNHLSPQSSIESVDHNVDSMNMQEIQSRDHHHHYHHHQDHDYYFSHYDNGGADKNPHQAAAMAAAFSKKRPPSCDLSELQALAFGMMKH